ncbi:MAG TPA: DUF6456 domain-containing protein [Rhizomicrobium sp.]
MSMSPQEIEREAQRVFRKLAEPGLFLAPELEGDYALAGSRRAGRILKVSASVVAEFRKRDWLRPRGTRPETFCLSDAGAGWLGRHSAVGDVFAAQHQLLGSRLIRTPEGERSVTVNEVESPLAWLKLRGLIDTAQYQAGERLRRDFTIAGLMPRLSADLTAPISNGRGGAKSEPLAEKVISAKQRFRLAMSAVGPGLSDLLFDVCCHLKGLETIESANEWPTRSAKVVLQIALDRLATHYGIAMRAVTRGRVRSWHAEEIRVGG